MLPLRFIPLVLKQLTRRRVRTILTLMGVATAMFLFSAVQAMQSGVREATTATSKETTLVVYRQNRYCPFTSRLPQYYEQRISASTQNQALCAIVFLYKQVLAVELGPDHLGPFQALRARRSVRVPTVLSSDEIERLIAALPEGSMARLMVRLMYGTGLRIKECCTLRVRDLDFDRRQIVVRAGKGDKDRLLMLPGECAGDLAARVRHVRQRRAHELRRGGGLAPCRTWS